MRMDGATQTLNELLAPVMNILGIQDAWIIVACIAALLFLLFFFLFVSRCVKIGRLKKVIREKDVEITGLATAARKQQGISDDGMPASSVVYSAASVAGRAGTSELTGEVNPYARVSGEDGVDGAGTFDDAWRSENTQFLEKCETGVLYTGEGSQESRHLTDVIFGGTRAGEDDISRVGDEAEYGKSRKMRQAQQQAMETAEEIDRAAAAMQENPQMDKIRGLDLDKHEEKSVLFPEEEPAEQAQRSGGRSSGLSSKIPHL